MLDAFVIEEIKRRERERERSREDRPVVELPVPVPMPNHPIETNEPGHDDEPGRGVVIIDYTG